MLVGRGRIVATSLREGASDSFDYNEMRGAGGFDTVAGRRVLMAIGTIALALAATAAHETPLFELVPVPPEYAAIQHRQKAPPPPAARRKRRAPPPPPIYVPAPAPPPVYVLVAPPSPPPPTYTVPVAPPPPPTPSRIVTPLRPLNPGSWVTNDDYPAAAIRAEQSGTVGFQLTVTETGVVTACDVIASSGSAILDATSCSLMRRRAKFLPALDAEGHGVPAIWRNRFRWELPEDPEVPMTSWASTLRFTIGGDNQLLSCAYQGYAAPELGERSPCIGISELPRETMRKLRGRSKGAVAIYVRYDHVVAGLEAPALPALPAKYKPIASWSSQYSVETTGNRVACSGNIDELTAPMPVVTCQSYHQYRPEIEAHSVTATIRFYTDGDAAVAAAVPLLGSVDE